jgi:hypothetical protein
LWEEIAGTKFALPQMQKGIAEILHPINFTRVEDSVKYFDISQLTGKIFLLSLIQLLGASIAWSGDFAPMHGQNWQHDQYNDRNRHEEERERREEWRRDDWRHERRDNDRDERWRGDNWPPRHHRPCVEQWSYQPIAELSVRGDVAELSYGRSIEARIARWFALSGRNPYVGRNDVQFYVYNVRVFPSYGYWRSEQFTASIRVLGYRRVCR